MPHVGFINNCCVVCDNVNGPQVRPADSRVCHEAESLCQMDLPDRCSTVQVGYRSGRAQQPAVAPC